MSNRSIVVVSALLAAGAVALGAYAAHGLAERIDAIGYADKLEVRVAWFETGVKYQWYHTLAALLSVALTANAVAPKTARRASFAFFLGILLFSGSLYAMTFAPAEWQKLGAVTPLGGLSFIVGWVILAVGAWRDHPES